ncbi:unnamed protein product, partial [Ectocarpus sp. 12 AP-2014]
VVAYVQSCETSAISDGSCEDDAGAGYRFVYDTLVSCTGDETERGTCDNTPVSGRMWNPCYTAEVRIDVSVSGSIFSGDGLFYPHSTLPSALAEENYMDYTVDATFATYTVVMEDYWLDDTRVADMDARRCMTTRISEEGDRQREQGWFLLRALQTAQMSFDLSHIPSSMVYDEHYKLAIYVTPSRCDDEVCNSARIRLPAAEKLPCRQPLDMPAGFLDSSIPKNQTLNFTIFALEDVLLKTEVHVMHGLFTPSAAFFRNTTTLKKMAPSRAKTRLGTVPESRALNPFVSFEERKVVKEYFFAAVYYESLMNTISAPLNMPPRYAEFSKGRVLVGFNTSSQNMDTPWLRDDRENVA